MNIWTPSSRLSGNMTLVPVYVWIHGGRYTSGSSDVITYDGSGLASHGFVCVSYNYRLGDFGYPVHPDLTAKSAHNSSGNYGTMDIVRGLDWLRSEVSKFGGDRNQMTVGGQSSGPCCAFDMMYSPLSKNLIASVIAESGARFPHNPMTGSLVTS